MKIATYLTQIVLTIYSDFSEFHLSCGTTRYIGMRRCAHQVQCLKINACGQETRSLVTCYEAVDNGHVFADKLSDNRN